MSSSSSRRHRLAEHLNYLKTDYRPRFCCGRGNEINVHPGQDVMKFIEDCFKNADSDLTIGSPSPNLYLPSVVQDEKTTSTPNTSPNAGLSKSVKRACSSAESLPTANSRDPEDDHTPVGSPVLLEEEQSSPVHMLHLDDQSTAAVKGYLEGENLEDLQTARDEQVDLLQGTERTAMSSVRKEKSFALMALAALAPGALGERYSTSISQPSPPPVKDRAIEVEGECEFLIVSDDAPSTSSFPTPWKSTKSKKDGSAIPVTKSQPSEKKTTESKNSKNKKVQVGALSKQKMLDLDIRVHDSKGAPQSDPVSSNSEKKVFKSRRQSSTHMGKAKENSLRQGSPNQKKDVFWEPEAKELVLSQSGLETEASGSDQCKARVMPSEDLPVPSSGHQQEWTVSLKTYLKSSKHLQLASKASQHLAHKKQNAHQKISKDEVAERLAESLREKHEKSGKKSSNKKPQLRRGESSDSEAGEEGLEIQPVQLTEVLTSPLPQKLRTSVVQKLDKSGRPKNAWDAWKSLGDAGNTTPVKALDIDSVQNSGKKRSSAKSGKMPKKIPHRTSKDVCSDPEDASDTQNKMDSDSSSVQHVARKKQKPSAIKIKSNKRKRNMQHGLQDTFADEEAVGYERYSTSISQPSPPPVKDRAIEVEGECEFLIVSDDAPSTSSFPTPWKSTKSKKDGSAIPVTKSQPSEKKTTESKNSKNKVQVGALSKQKMLDLDIRVHDSKGAPQSDPVSSNSEKKVFKSRRQSSTHMGKAKENSLRQGSPNQKKDVFWEPEAKELVLSQSGLETEASGSDQCKARVMPSEDLPVPSSGHQQEWTVSLKTYLKSSKHLQLASKASQHLAHKKQNAHQKISKDEVAERLAESLREKHEKSGKKSSNKKPQLRRGESSDSEAGEEGLEIQPVQLTEVLTSPLPQKLRTSVVQKLDKSGRPKNAWDAWKSLGDAGNTTPVKALDIDSVQNSGKKRSSAKSGKMPKKIPHRTSKDVCSDPEDASDTQNKMDSDSSSVQHVARKKQKPSAIKIKSNKRKRNMQHGLQDTFADEEAVGYESGPVLEPGDKFTSRNKSSEQDNTFSENSEDWDCQVKNLLSDTTRHKIVMPSNTPNVRRTKRIRMRPLEYWRGERVNYTMRPSGELVFSGIVCPETEPPRKIKWRKRGLKQKRYETRSEVPANLDHTLADTSKPTVVLDPVTNKEVLQECINTENNHSCFFKDETVEIYKNLNTSAFATGTLILKPFKEKGHQYVYMDTIAFHVIHGQIIVTLHKSSYYLTAGDDFYVPAGTQLNLLSAGDLKLTCGECNKPKELFPHFMTAEKTKTKQHVDGDLFTITLPAS